MVYGYIFFKYGFCSNNFFPLKPVTVPYTFGLTIVFLF